MENLIIQGSEKTPAIHFDFQKGILEIKGRSIIENPWGFYLPVTEWLEEYVKKNACRSSTIIFDLEYYNTTSSKSILDMIRVLEQLPSQGHSVYCKWYQEGEEVDDILLFVENLKVEIIYKASE